MAADKGNTPVSFTEADGRRLATDMLREIQHDWENQNLEGVPDEVDAISEAMLAREPTILRRYLAAASQGAAVERGFLCVLSDFIGVATNVGSPNLEKYEA